MTHHEKRKLEREKQNEQLAALGLRAEVSLLGQSDASPFPIKGDEKPWPHFTWSIQIIRNHNFHVFQWHCGIGHVDRITKMPTRPNPVEVISTIARDYLSACESFSNWCGEFGYDTDSLCARRIYDACQEQGDALLRLISRAQLQELAQMEW